jgi:hypothetical protein
MNDNMKKIINVLIITFVCALMLPACSDDDGIAVISDKLDITSASGTDLPAKGGDGTIVLATTDKVEVVAKDSWLSASVSGNTVKISAGHNLSVTGRFTHVTITSGGKSVIVPVSQYGLAIIKDENSVVFTTDKSSSATVKFKSNGNILFESSVDWISYSVLGDSLKVSVAENKTGAPRAGFLRYTVGAIKDSIAVEQVSMQDYIGTWKLYGYNTSGKLSAETAVLTAETDSTLTSTIAELFNAKFIYRKGKLVLQAGQRTGTYTTSTVSYPIYLCLGEASGSLTGNSTVEYAVSPTSEDGVVLFNDNGTWPGYEVNSFYMYVFTSTTLSPQTMFGSYMYMETPFMIKQSN